MKEFFIVNAVDRPCEDMIAFKREDGKLCYASSEPRLRGYDGMDASRATPLGDFGLDVDIRNGRLIGRVVRGSTASYPNGSTRPWQGSREFVVLLREDAR